MSNKKTVTQRIIVTLEVTDTDKDFIQIQIPECHIDISCYTDRVGNAVQDAMDRIDENRHIARDRLNGVIAPLLYELQLKTKAMLSAKNK